MQSDKAMHPDKAIHLKAPAAGNGLTKVKDMATFTIWMLQSEHCLNKPCELTWLQ